MRGQIIDALFRRMAERSDLFFLTADMGINLVEKFQEAYPDRFVNVGIAEQNLIGVSAGLANLGYRPFAYTISNFAVHRCFEQIRNDMVIHGYPITILGTSTGYDNAPLGPTHHIIDDWGTLRTLPGINVYCPSSVSYASTLLDRVLDAARPAYIRIPKGGFTVPESGDDVVLVPGERQRTLLCTYGSLAQTCLTARDRDPSLSVMVFNRLHPLDDAMVQGLLGPYERIIVVEDHIPETGLFGGLAALKARLGLAGRLIPLGPTAYRLEAGSAPEHFHKAFGFDVEGILRAAA